MANIRWLGPPYMKLLATKMYFFPNPVSVWQNIWKFHRPTHWLTHSLTHWRTKTDRNSLPDQSPMKLKMYYATYVRYLQRHIDFSGFYYGSTEEATDYVYLSRCREPELSRQFWVNLIVGNANTVHLLLIQSLKYFIWMTNGIHGRTSHDFF